MQETKSISAYKFGLRNRILETAMKDFAERGIRAVKMDDVAAELGISKRTLYEVFETKELLLLEGVRMHQELRNSELSERTARCKNVMEILLVAYKAKVEGFRKTNPQFYSDLSKYPKVARYLNQENQKMKKNTAKFLERGIYEGYFREEINVELICRLLDAQMKYVMVNQLYYQYTIEEILVNILFVSVRGICMDKGQAALEQII